MAPAADLALLFDFVHTAGRLCVRGAGPVEPGAAADPEPVAADLAAWRSLTQLRLERTLFSMLAGTETLHPRLALLAADTCGIASLPDVFYAPPSDRRPSSTVAAHSSSSVVSSSSVSSSSSAPAPGGEQWRAAAAARLTGVRAPRMLPWVALTTLSLPRNNIALVDPSCLRLMPALEVLDLQHNAIATLAPWLEDGAALPALRVLNLAHNAVAKLFLPAHLRSFSLASSLHCIDFRDMDESRRRAPSPEVTRRAAPLVSPGWSRSAPSASTLAAATAAAASPPPPAPPAPAVAAVAAVTAAQVRPTPNNTAPPPYSSQLLIATNMPNAPLDELQRRRAEVLALLVSDRELHNFFNPNIFLFLLCQANGARFQRGPAARRGDTV